MNDSDTLQRFLFDSGDVRGELVQLDSALQEALDKHDYPPALAALLGESLAATVLLSATLKMNGRVALQARGTGSVSLLVAECNDQRGVRGIIHGSADNDQQQLGELLGQGQLTIILEPENGQRYQGIVPLESPNLSGCLQDYFTRSEQLSTFILLACNGQQAAGLMLQKMPGSTRDSDLWERVTQLAATTSQQELLTLAPDELLHRLFHEEQLQRYPTQPVAFYCHCSRERTENALHTMGAQECYEMLAKESTIAVNCQFCNQHYRFDQSDLERLFGPPERH
ncbi:MAG: Hsp33 family molecular chaperone HslO [Halomonadaceae bacterium]|nr:MAG: Hsp33 family molecular chaperone HslO [Halomonadaceae bacterium]